MCVVWHKDNTEFELERLTDVCLIVDAVATFLRSVTPFPRNTHQ